MYKPKMVKVYKDGEFYKEFRAQYEAAEYLDINKDKFRRMLYEKIDHKGYTAEYSDPEDRARKPHRRNFGNQKKPVFQYSKDGLLVDEYASIAEASRKIDISKNCIRRAVKEKRALAAGFYWRHVKTHKIFVSDNKKLPRVIDGPVKGKTVVAFDMDQNEIKEFISITQAAKWAGVHRTAVSLVLTGRQKRAGGYVWKYKNN